MKKQYFGLLAEYFTIALYLLKFYKILHHRKRYYVGEIDIIAVRAKELVFIEVKARNSNFDEYILSLKQRKRIKNAAEIFISSNHVYRNYDIRFDLVIVRVFKWPIIIKNAW